MASPRRTTWPVVGLAALALLLAGVAVWFHEDPASATAPFVSHDAPSAAGDAGPGELPSATSHGEVRPLAHDGEPAGTVAAADASAAPTLATVGMPVRLTGRVVDVHGAPVAGASLTWLPSRRVFEACGMDPSWYRVPVDFDALPRTESDADGRFSLDVRELEPPESTVGAAPRDAPGLVVRHPAYESQAHRCVPYLRGATDAGDIVVRPGATLTGRVVDAAGAPIAGATLDHAGGMGAPDSSRRVEFEWLRMLPYAPTGADGRFELTGLWAGEQDLRIAADGHVPIFPDVSLAAGARLDLGDVALAAAGRIRGTVRDAEGAPVARAQVKARPVGGMTHFKGAEDADFLAYQYVIYGNANVEYRVRADDEGRFALDSLEEDAYDLYAGAEGYEPASPKAVPAGTEDLEVVLQRPALAVVTVRDAVTGDPVPGVTGTAWRFVSEEGDLNRRGRLDVLRGDAAVRAAGDGAAAEGLLVVRGIGPALNTLVVSAPGYEAHGFLLPTASAPERVTKVVTLERGSGVTGRVLDPTGAPVPDATVTLAPPDAQRVPVDPLTALSDEDGVYRFEDVTHGDWSLTAIAPACAPSAPRVVPVPKAALVEGVDVVLSPAARVRGLVLAVDGQPAVSARVTLAPSDRKADHAEQARLRAEADLDGRFEIGSVEPGAYRAIAGSAEPVDLALAAGDVADVTLTLRPYPIVRGRVVEAGVAVPFARVRVETRFRDDTFIGEFDVSTDVDGRYQAELPEAGRFRLSAFLPGASGDEQSARTQAQEIEAAWGQTLLVDLAFGSGRVRGRVVAADTGAGLEAYVEFERLRDESGAVIETREPRHERTVLSDLSGRFEADHVLPGRYEFRANAPGYVAGSAELTVAGATSVLPDVRLVLGGLLEGTVRTPAGAAPPKGLTMLLASEQAGEHPWRWALRTDGTYKVSELPPGRYVLSVLRRGEAAAGGEPVDETLVERSIDVVGGRTERVDLVVDG